MTAAVAPAPAHAQTPFEAQVLVALNAVRADPQAFAATLRTFRTYFHGVAYLAPGERVQNITSEGVAAVDEAIAFMTGQPGMAAVAASSGLAAAAADHAVDQAASGAIGHRGADGSLPFDRVQRHGGGQSIAEVIAYGAGAPRDVVRQLIVDDGVANRGHRSILFDPALRYAGVACGPHPVYRMMCVIDMDAGHNGATAGIKVADAGE